MLTINVADLKTAELQNYLQYAIAPRPICFVSTIDRDGNVNLSPFSFFNMFSTNPPVCIFSPARRVRDNTTKHSLENVLEVPECVINVVNYSMVQQTSLASVEYPKGTNEFIKAGFTQLASDLVKPPRVAESPVQMECTIREVISLGENAGAGNLVLAEIKLIHINEEILDESGKIDQAKIDLVARLGGDWYCRVTEANLFKVEKPVRTLGIGVDLLPASIRNSDILTGNNLGQLGNVEAMPSDEEIEKFQFDPELRQILNATIGDNRTRERELHQYARTLLEKGNVNVTDAWKVLLSYEV
ncbi:NADH-FMN oxidoreductase RutF, flavin reductase (DIM6/NTAB) family [Daejeonella rubra]|uniref:NADH-FMN oxidoreductase RutF, flavin reductase (DIM6/NTAB) family n=1 Tax=Daejeonella rubra TaxID=990371 RepID=A0A1G9TAW8_9SPHI|nr:flavin reductase family protein [Daejeonella rubra]SDM44758.1 NADH-FMN oxidoreductase RutF, flavin reductase (DIM6/NTAB) family [Daejeonella rubra]